MAGPRWLHRLVAPLRRRARDREMQEEMAFHLESIRLNYKASGLTQEDAEHAALRRFGSTLRHKESGHEARGFRAIDDLLMDVRHALRGLRRTPGFTFVVVLTLAFGFGVTNTVFTFVNAILLRSLPFDHPDRIVALTTEDSRGRLLDVSRPDFDDWRAQTHSFAGMAVFASALLNVSDEGRPAEQLAGTYGTANTFDVLGTRPLLGRDFRPADDQPGAEPAAILSYALWTGRYGSDPAIVGKTIRVNSLACTVIGVMPRGMQFPLNNDLWMPWSKLPPVLRTASRSVRNVRAFGRLASGVTLAQARSELDALGAHLAHDHPESNQDVHPVVRPYTDQVAGPQIRGIFNALMAAVVFVLLIACANVANLLLARGSSRAREMAVRLSLGASRWRIVRQLLVESLVLSTVSGVLGFGLSFVGVRVFDTVVTNAAGIYWKPYWMAFTMDARVVAFLAAICVATGVIFGLAPALHFSRAGTKDVFKESNGRAGVGTVRARQWTSALLIAEVSLTLVLLGGAGFMMRTFLALYRMDLQVDTSRLLTLRVNLPLTKYPKASSRGPIYRQLEERLRGVSGIEASALTTNTPVGGAMLREVSITGRATPAPGKGPRAAMVAISTNYFEAVGTPLVRGRRLTESDETPGHFGAIVNQRFVAMNFQNEDPIGRLIALKDVTPVPVAQPAPAVTATIVGVVPNVPQTLTLGDPEPAVYVPYLADPPRGIILVVRTQGDPILATSLMREGMRSVDPDVPFYAIQTLDDTVSQRRWPYRIFGSMFVIFAGIALALSALGLYAVTAYSVSQRTPEFGVRMALGARSEQVLWLVLRRAVWQLAIALPVGIAGAALLGRILRSFFPQLPARDLGTIATMAVLMAVISVAACLAPARRATRLDPAMALRDEG